MLFLLHSAGSGARLIYSLLSALGKVRRGGGRIPIPPNLRDALYLLSTLILSIPPRTIRLASNILRTPVVIWTDAMWENSTASRAAFGGIGAVVWLPPGHPMARARGRFLYGARTVGAAAFEFAGRDRDLIGQAELVAAVSPYISLPNGTLTDWPVIHFVDNSSALYGLVKGSSSVASCWVIIQAFLVANLALRAQVWFNYVASKANIADLPSRGAISEMGEVLSGILPDFSLSDDVFDMRFPPCGDVQEVWAELLPRAGGSRPRSHRSRTRG